MTKSKRLVLTIVLLCFVAMIALTACTVDPVLTVTFDSTHTVYDGDTLDSLKPYFTVKYTDEKGHETQVADYTLAGTLTKGVCVVLVSYKGLERTVLITVQAASVSTYTVTFKAEDAIVATLTFTTDNKTITEPQVPAKTGYVGMWEDYELSNSDITVNAVYTAKNYELKLDYSGADGNNTQQTVTVTYNQNVGTLPTPTKTDFKFIGWYLGEEEITADTVWTTDSDSQLTLVAQWERDKGSFDNPYTVDEAVERTNMLASGQHSDEPVYVIGMVSTDSSMGIEGDLLFYITDENQYTELYIYYASCNLIGVDSVKVGDIVVIYGYLCNYNGNTPEMKKNNNLKPQIIYVFDSGAIVPEKGTLDNPYTVSEAIELIDELALGAKSDNIVYIEGIVSGNINKSTIYDSQFRFDLQDSVSGETMHVYYALSYLSSTVLVGDKVVVSGYLYKYSTGNGFTPEITYKDSIYECWIEYLERDEQPLRIEIYSYDNYVEAGDYVWIAVDTYPYQYAYDVELYIKQGEEYGYIDGNYFYGIKAGECVIVGRIGDLESNELVISVYDRQTVEYNITLSVDETIILVGDSISLRYTVSPYYNTVQFNILSGSECVTNAGSWVYAFQKGTVEIQACIGDSVSNTIVLIIFDPVDDPYTNVTSNWFHNYNYNPATSLEDSYWRTQHNLMSGAIDDQDQAPTIASNQPKLDNKYVRNSATYYIDNGNTWEVVDSSGNVVNKIYKCGAYVTLEDVAAYVYAFGDVPANYIESNSTGELKKSSWGKYLRLNHNYFSGNTSSYPYEPALPRISGIGNGDLRYYEIDIGTTGTDCDPNYDSVIYNDGNKITRGAARIVYSRYYRNGNGNGEHIDDLEERYVFYTYNHYNDFQEYLNYRGGWGEMFGNITGGGQISSRYDYNPTPYVDVVRRNFFELF